MDISDYKVVARSLFGGTGSVDLFDRVFFYFICYFSSILNGNIVRLF